eukprot:Sdes_comp17485_c0_seq1m6721
MYQILGSIWLGGGGKSFLGVFFPDSKQKVGLFFYWIFSGPADENQLSEKWRRKGLVLIFWGSFKVFMENISTEDEKSCSSTSEEEIVSEEYCDSDSAFVPLEDSETEEACEVDPEISKKFPSTPSTGTKRKGVFGKELKYMMYGFGDHTNPLPESVSLMEDIVIDYIGEIVSKAQLASGKSMRITTEDLLFVIKKDRKKYSRVRNLLYMNEELKRARKAFELDPEVPAVEENRT